MADDAGRSGEAEARREYGVLATGLSESVGAARDALAVHSDLLPSGRVSAFDDLLAEFDRRRVRVALYGEVKAGKSTLLNALAGRELSPAAFDPMTTLPLRATYGPETLWRVADRTCNEIADVIEVMRADAPAAEEIVAETPADLLQLGGQVDLLDTPGIGSDDRSDAISAEALRSLDAVVLVVRYPALFTKATRQIMAGLQEDIGKLFVVWNLDADCAELSGEEREQFAARLRADVAGAHELYLVDARAGLRAREQGDEAAARDSGLEELVAALGRFASSEKREVAALRETAKTVDSWFDDAVAALAKRRDYLAVKIEETESRLQDVAAASDAEQRAAKDQFDHLQSSLELAEKNRESGMQRCASFMRKSLRAARRGWAKNGDVEALRTRLQAAAEAYESGAQTVGRDFTMALARAAAEFGSQFNADAPAAALLSAEPVAPDERLAKSMTGRGQWLRRAVWRRWFLPGVAQLERETLAQDLESRAAWGHGLRDDAASSMREVLQERLVDILQRADSDENRVKEESNYDAEVAEAAALAENLPAVQTHRQQVAELKRQAWDLVG